MDNCIWVWCCRGIKIVCLQGRDPRRPYMMIGLQQKKSHEVAAHVNKKVCFKIGAQIRGYF